MKNVLAVIGVIAIMVLGFGCNQWQKDNCRNNGGQPVTRMYEYTGCVEGQ